MFVGFFFIFKEAENLSAIFVFIIFSKIYKKVNIIHTPLTSKRILNLNSTYLSREFDFNIVLEVKGVYTILTFFKTVYAIFHSWKT